MRRDRDLASLDSGDGVLGMLEACSLNMDGKRQSHNVSGRRKSRASLLIDSHSILIVLHRHDGVRISGESVGSI